MQARGPARGYYPEPTKSILVVAPGKFSWAEEHFRGLGIRVVTGHHYLVGFIGDADAEREWLREKVQGWTESVNVLAGVAHKQPQSAYAGLQNSLQQEWDFVHRVTLGVGEASVLVEEALREIFVPELFKGLREGVLERENTRLPAKQAGLALPDPLQAAPEKWTASCVITGHLVASLRGQVVFQTADHLACLWRGQLAVRHRGEKRAEEALMAALEGAPVLQERRMRRAAKTRAWLTVLPSTVNGTDLGAQDCRDALFLRYGLELPDLPKYWDGCEVRFSISHSLDCKKGGLVTACHNELRDGVADLAGKAFTLSHVRDDPLIYSGRAVSRMKPTLAGSTKPNPTIETPAAPEVTEQKGDLLIRDLWQQVTDSVHDMRVVNTDTRLYLEKAPEF